MLCRERVNGTIQAWRSILRRFREPIPDERLSIGDHGLQRATPGAPPLDRPIEGTQYQHLRYVQVEVSPQSTRSRHFVDQSPPHFAVALFLEELALSDPRRDLARVADGCGRVVRYLEFVSQMCVDRGEQTI